MNKFHILIFLVIVGALYVIFDRMGNDIPTDYHRSFIANDIGHGFDTLQVYSLQNNSLMVGKVWDTDSMLNTGDLIISTKNKGAVKVGDSNPESLRNTRTIKIALFKDRALSDLSLDTAKYAKDINKVLKTLNSGIEIKWASYKKKDLSEFKTEGVINTNALTRNLENSSKNKYYAFLFKESQFFNTANAIAVPVKNDNGKDQVFILGNGYLLESPYLFAHELFHALGLTHNNEMYNPCGETFINSDTIHLSNVMNEANIGCSRRLTGRQIAILNTDEYIYPIENDPLFPDSDTCECHFKGLGNQIEQYLNSFDRNIDDTPLVGDDAKFLKTIVELDADILPTKIENVVKKNYINEAKELADIGADTTGHVSKRIDVLKKLRYYNFCRWMKENMEAKGIEVNSTFWELDSAALDSNFMNYYTTVMKGMCRTGNEIGCQIDDPLTEMKTSGWCNPKLETNSQGLALGGEMRLSTAEQFNSAISKFRTAFKNWKKDINFFEKDVEQTTEPNQQESNQEQDSEPTKDAIRNPNQPDKDEQKSNKKGK